MQLIMFWYKSQLEMSIRFLSVARTIFPCIVTLIIFPCIVADSSDLTKTTTAHFMKFDVTSGNLTAWMSPSSVYDRLEEFKETLNNLTFSSLLEQRHVWLMIKLAEKYKDLLEKRRKDWEGSFKLLTNLNKKMSYTITKVMEHMETYQRNGEEIKKVSEFKDQSARLIENFIQQIQTIKQTMKLSVSQRPSYHLAENNSLASFRSRVFHDACEPVASYTTQHIPVMMKIGEECSFLCDTQTDGGGWIVFQRRVNGEVNFDRTWQEYQKGFGSINTEYWLGNDKLLQLTSENKYQLRIDMTVNGTLLYAQYDTFCVSGNKFRLTVGQYSGTAGGDRMAALNGVIFTARDRIDNEKPSGASNLVSGWWIQDRPSALLNGRYGGRGPDGVYWKEGVYPTIVEMKMRKKN